MRARSILIVTLAGALLLAGGVVAATAASHPTPPPGDAFVLPCTDGVPTADPVTGSVKVRAGDTFTVRLCTNPSTGYAWGDPSFAPASGVALVSRTTVPGAENQPGAAGTEVLTFRAATAGTTTITLAYGQPWAGGDQAGARVVLTVVAA